MTNHQHKSADKAESKTLQTSKKTQDKSQSPLMLEGIQRQLAMGQSANISPQMMLQLQRTIGNQGLSKLLESNTESPSKKSKSTKPMLTTESETDESQDDRSGDELLQRTSMQVKTGMLSKKHRIYDAFGVAIATVAGGEVLDVDTESTIKTKNGKKAVEVRNAQEADSFSYKKGGLGVGGSDGLFIKASNLKPAKAKEDAQPSAEEEQLLEIQTGRTGHTGAVGQAIDGGSAAATAKSMKSQGEELVEGIQAGNFDDKIDAEEQGVLAKQFNALGSKLNGSLESVGVDTAVSSDFMSALTNSQAMFDKIMDIASKGIPIVSSVVKVGLSADAAWTGWKTYSAWKGAAQDALDILAPSEDMSGDINAPLLSVQPSTKTAATYAQAKSLRALVSKIIGFARSIAKAVGEIAALFTGGLGNLISLSASILGSVATAGRWLKALYKIAKNTKGKNRETNANIVMEAATGGDDLMLKTLVDLALTDDIWMITLAAKMGTTYNPKTDGSGWIAKAKGVAVGAASKQASKYAAHVKELGSDLGENSNKAGKLVGGKINEQFIEDASIESMETLLNIPTSADEMFDYLQELQVVGMYGDFAEKVFAKMGSK